MRPLQILVLLVALVLASKAVQAGYSIETAGLKVIFPPDNKKTVQMAMADFGKPRYGATMM